MRTGISGIDFDIIIDNLGSGHNVYNYSEIKRNINNDDVLFLQLANNVEENVDFRGRKRGGRFVQHEHFGMIAHRFRDLNDLALPHGKARYDLLWIDVDFHHIQHVLRVGMRAVPVD